MRTEARSEREAVVSTTSANRTRSRTPMRSISRRRNRLERVQPEFSGGDTLQTLPDHTFHPALVGAVDNTILLGQPVQQQRIADEGKSRRVTVPEDRAHQVQHAGALRRYSNTADRLTPLASQRSQ